MSILQDQWAFCQVHWTALWSFSFVPATLTISFPPTCCLIQQSPTLWRYVYKIYLVYFLPLDGNDAPVSTEVSLRMMDIVVCLGWRSTPLYPQENWIINISTSYTKEDLLEMVFMKNISNSDDVNVQKKRTETSSGGSAALKGFLHCCQTTELC